jgi:CHAT domain-containing protein/tetratricopeptide (TPR) repeat protein
MRLALDSFAPLFVAALLTLAHTPALADTGAYEADSIRALITARRFGPAETRARELVRQLDARSPRDSLRLGDALNLQAEAMWRGGHVNDAEAESVAARAVRVRERTRGRDHLDFATSLHNQANLLRIAGRLDRLDQRYREVLEIRLTELGPEHPDVARTLNDHGNLLSLIGDYSGAESLYVRACATYERLIETQRRNVGACLNNLALLAQARGDYARARAIQERSLALFTEALGPDHTNVALACVNLARTLAILGERAEAQRLLERALDIHVRTLGPDHADVAWNLRDLAQLQAQSGDFDLARRSLERAVEIHVKALGANHTETALDLSALADVEEAAHRDSVAVELHQQALTIHEQALGPRHPRVALDLMGLGRLSARRGHLAHARLRFERTLSIRGDALGPDHPLTAEAERALGDVQWAMGDTTAAFESALRAENQARAHFRLLQQSLPERLALNLSDERNTGLDLAVTVCLASPTPDRRARVADAIVRSRAIVLDEMIQRLRFTSERNDPRLDTLARNLSSARERLSNLSVRVPEREPAGRYLAMLDSARAERERAERALAEASVGFRGRQQQQDAGLVAIRSEIPSGSTLVSYLVVDRHAPFVRRDLAGGTPAVYIACVIRSDGSPPAIVRLASAAYVDSLATRVWKQLAGGAEQPVWRLATAEREYRSTGAALRRAVWDPVESLLGPGERVLIVPDGALGLVDFAALPAASGYLVERGRLFHYLSAERVLVTSRREGASGQGLLVVGGPDFGGESGAGRDRTREDEPHPWRAVRGLAAAESDPCAPQLPSFRPLPRSALEAEAIERYWERRHPAAGSPNRTQSDTAITLTGRDATEDAFRRLAPGRQVLHLATHGFVLGERCRADLELGSSRTRPPAYPASIGGLAFSGANRRQGSGPHDGVLTAEEIAGLDLSGVEWTVLSACNTGVGEVRAGEGVFGLRRAFEVAGCRTLILSLWPTDDETARDWMAQLYEARFVRRLDTAAALRAADRAMLGRRRARHESTHPRGWAGFIAAGDWR